MKAMLLDRVAPIESSPLKLVDLPTPEPLAGEVRVAVHCCGVCRTDLHVVEGDLVPQKMPVVPGHEIVGVIDAVGPGCRHMKVGQRVGVAWLRWTCGRCRFCTAGRENLCESARFTGYQADGGYAEFAVVPEDFAYEIPDAFADVEAAPLLCAGIIGYRALKRSRLPPGGRMGLYGFGSSAHLLIQIVRHRGSEVYVVARDAAHRDLARRLGAVWTGARIEELPVLVQSAILFAPVGDMVPAALEKLDKGGTLALAGIYMTPIPSMDYRRYVFHERDIHSVTSNTREDGRELLAEAAEIGLHPHTVVYPLSEANRALQDLKADRINGTGVLMVEN
jgi:alcohol dehydrogenase, propanol-preferring